MTDSIKASRMRIKEAVAKVLATNSWPICRTYDDAGLDEDGYVEFCTEVFAALSHPPEASRPDVCRRCGEVLATEHGEASRLREALEKIIALDQMEDCDGAGQPYRSNEDGPCAMIARAALAQQEDGK